MGVVVSREQNGPIRTSIEMSGPALRLFSQKDQNTILRTVMQMAAQLFIDVFLPKRFEPYARTFLGYTASGKYENRKRKLAAKGIIASPQPTPLVYTGASREGALGSARATSTATVKRLTAIVRFARGAINYKKAAVLQTIPRHEVSRMASLVQTELPRLID